MEGTMAVVTCFAADFAPQSWAFCNGQTLAINTNQALFSLLGTTFGGNGVTTFQLPNLMSRSPLSPGQGNGLPNYQLGELGGLPTVSLNLNNIPAHTHTGVVPVALKVNSVSANQKRALNTFPAPLTNAYAAAGTGSDTLLSPTNTFAVSVVGASAPVSIRNPFLGMNYIICLFGIFPSRN